MLQGTLSASQSQQLFLGMYSSCMRSLLKPSAVLGGNKGKRYQVAAQRVNERCAQTRKLEKVVSYPLARVTCACRYDRRSATKLVDVVIGIERV